MHIINVHLTAAQQRKAQKGQSFQISAAAMSKDPNTHLMMHSKPKQSQFARNKRNNRGFRLIEGQYSTVPADVQAGGDIAYRGGPMQGKGVGASKTKKVKPYTEHDLSVIRDKTGDQYLSEARAEEQRLAKIIKTKTAGGKLVKGSQEAKDRMAAMRAMRKGGSVEGGKLNFGSKINKAFSKKNVSKAVKQTKKGIVDTYRSKEFKQVADIGTDIGLAYAQQKGYVTKDQAKDLKKLKKAAIHEDTDGMKKAAIEGAKNEGERQVRSQMAGGALKETNVKRKPKGASNVTMYTDIPKTIKSGKGIFAAGRGIIGSGFLP